MSLLSRPQGTPERVWSLVGGLAGAGGEIGRDEFAALLNPGYLRGGQEVRATPILIADATGVATALGLVERDGGMTRLSGDTPGSPAALANHVHDRLCAAPDADADAVILQAYAWLVAEAHRRQDISWMFDVGAATFVDMMASGLIGQDEEGGRPMNTTKAPAWRRWLRFLGLGVPLPDDGNDFPSPARRIVIELRRAGMEPGVTVGAEEFVRLIGQRCPYLDRGRLFALACERIGYRPAARQLSPVLTLALRELEADGLLTLMLSGDSSDALILTPDPAYRTGTFNAVQLIAGDAS